MSYSNTELKALQKFYKNQLLNDTVPFWFPRSIDQTYGGYLLMRDQDGTLIDDDKAVWIQGRAAWLLSTLYNTVEQKKEWLDGAKSGIDFLNQYCFDSDGQMFFHVTRDGRPIRKRRYYFSETFAVIANAAYAKASGDEQAAEKARYLFGKCIEYSTIPGILPAKFTAVRPAKGIGTPMIMINTAQQLRETIGDPRCDEWIDRWINEIERDFVKDDIRCVMEQVAPDGSIIDHIDGRTLNPGHAIEGAWFILHEAKHRGNDPRLIALGCKMLDYMWERGWDKEHGGILYFKDVYNKPVQEYWQDMKFWWPHNEVIIATLLAYTMTGDPKYGEWHKLVHNYAYQHFHDKQHGEWFGYLHKDGSIAQTAKGNLFKGPFHLPRQEWYCLQLLANLTS
ncbi:N-acylglucosamine 2-epimerase [Pedobacter sp. HMWF019]|uniref:AGE family epimerase/isomerase n=1 Tax=Pedobacter sp. HMWF019 TaxID=2056856 RepID=UPI000D384C91|nr:AGE family epimerase/isomerase [Pedobacter sp. HMWF019]PTS99728.1 N-acylglucosamine 2-epimerase [Pedobacter sp. HMWF019]